METKEWSQDRKNKTESEVPWPRVDRHSKNGKKVSGWDQIRKDGAKKDAGMNYWSVVYSITAVLTGNLNQEKTVVRF